MIHGRFPARRRPHPYVRGTVRLPGVVDSWVLIDFVIDTGAAQTVVHAEDPVRRLGLHPDNLSSANWPSRRTVSARGVGGMALLLEQPGQLALFDREARRWVERALPLHLGEYPQTQYMPSLLGWDVLHGFRSEMNAARGIVHLEEQ